MDPSRHDFQPPVGSLAGAYKLVKMLGTGHFSIVYLARDNDGNEVALKLLRGKSGHCPVVFEEEKECLSKAGNAPFKARVVRLEEGWQDMGLGGCYCLATTPYCSGGSLEVMITSSPVPDLMTRLRWALEVAETLYLLHSTPGVRLYHGDVTVRNVALRGAKKGRFTAYVLDLGVALHNNPYGMREALKQYSASVAPEMEQGGRTFDQSADVWSWGVLLYALLSWSMRRMGGQDERDWLASLPHKPRAAWVRELLKPAPQPHVQEGNRYWVRGAEGPWEAVVDLMVDCLRPREERVGMGTVVHVMRTLLGRDDKPSPVVCLDLKLRHKRAQGGLCAKVEVDLLLRKAKAHARAQQHADRRICLERGLRLAKCLAETGHMHTRLLLKCLEQLGALHREAGEHDRAIPVYEEGLTCARAARPSDKDKERVAKWALLLAEISKNTRALELYEEALAIYKASLQPDRAVIADLLHRLARLYHSNGDVDLAMELFDKALDMYRDLKHPGAATVRQDLARLREGEGAQKAAVGVSTAALERRRLRSLPTYPRMAASRVTAARLHADKGGHAQALALYEEALTLNGTAPLPQRELAGIYHEIAVLYRQMGNSQQAVFWLEKELALRKETLPSTHFSIVRVLLVLASVYERMGQKEQAVPLCGEALEIHQDAPLQYDYVGPSALIKLGRLYKDKGEEERAIEVYKEALDAEKARFPRDELAVADLCFTLARLYEDRGEHQLAMESYEEALGIYKGMRPREERVVLFVLRKLGRLYEERGAYEQAIEAYKEALDLHKAACPRDEGKIALIFFALACLYKNKGEQRQATESCEECLTVVKGMLPRDERVVQIVLSKLGRLYEERGTCEQAIEAYKEALDVHKAACPRDEGRIALIFFALAGLYKNKGEQRLARLYQGKGEHQLAMESYEECLTVHKGMLPVMSE